MLGSVGQNVVILETFILKTSRSNFKKTHESWDVPQQVSWNYTQIFDEGKQNGPCQHAEHWKSKRNAWGRDYGSYSILKSRLTETGKCSKTQNDKFHCFSVHFDSLSFFHTNSCTFSYNCVSVFQVIQKSLKTLQEALRHVSIFYEIIFREFFIYFLVDVADIKNY